MKLGTLVVELTVTIRKKKISELRRQVRAIGLAVFATKFLKEECKAFYWIARCPELSVERSGNTKKQAMDNLLADIQCGRYCEEAMRDHAIFTPTLAKGEDS